MSGPIASETTDPRNFNRIDFNNDSDTIWVFDKTQIREYLKRNTWLKYVNELFYKSEICLNT